ncbi:branched-chain amino acid transaminase [Sorangium sp. So ce315]|uniref:branched-chain amino acid transaminase n=1 Tax=Sorangium sp. So ce315 TaxID=3133299 RepID=UPI003F63C334
MIQETSTLWLDGAHVGWGEGNVHLLTHTLHYGFGAIEGIRSYRQARGGAAIFRLDRHIERLFASAKAAFLEIPFDRATIERACTEAVRENGLEDAYIRPLVFVSEPNIVFSHWLNRVRVAVLTFPWKGYSDRGREEGTSATFSSYVRPKALAQFYKAKLCGHYALSVAAYSEARHAGYEQALFLDEDGMVCESTGENVFVVKGEQIATPPAARSILMGTTRASVLEIARDRGYRAEERDISRAECQEADEIFTTGTASGILPIRRLEGRPVGTGALGPVTLALQRAYAAATEGRSALYERWLTPL